MSRSKTPESNPEQYRREVVERLLTEWNRMPGLRLGQIIDNAMCTHRAEAGRGPDLFYIEDDYLAVIVESYVDKYSTP